MIDASLFAWPDADLATARQVFELVCIPELRRAVQQGAWVPERSESNPFLSKLVVQVNAADDVELRLHFYKGKSRNPNIHDHRWPFYSLVVGGTLQHERWTRTESGFTNRSSELLQPGDLYYVGCDEFHTAVASDDAITLLLRGPRGKDTWEMFDTEGRLVREFSSPRESDQAPFGVEEVHACLQSIPRAFYER